MPFTEANFENAILEIFRDLLGYEYLYGPDVVRDFAEPLCVEILDEALVRINPSLPRAAIDEAIARIRNIESGSLARKNARFTDMLQNGVAVNYFDGSEQRAGLVRLVDYDLPMRNRFTVANQWTVEERSVRRADIVVFVNGLPLVVVELKSPSREATDVSEAYAQLRNYMQEIPSLFVYNAFCVMSDLATTKAGTITAGEDRFMEWKTVDGKLEDARYANFDVLFRGMFEKSRFIELLGGFICCSEKDGKDIKILSAYHQFYAVRKAVESTLRAAETDGRGGVFWHTQGSGKSLSMVFFAKRLQRAMASPTIVVLTDRNDLDGQLYGQFAQCGDFLRQVPVQASSRAHLRELLAGREANGIFFSTMQKFEEGDGPLSERRNIVVMVDEAHRSQYGLEEHIDPRTGRVRTGAARLVRNALPNATYIGFTGTPIAQKDRSTREVFGDYIDVYDMTQAVEDGATRPVFYESRVVNLHLDEATLRRIDAEYDAMAEEAEEYAIEKSKRELGRIDSILGADATVASLCEDIVKHYEEFRQYEQTGKAMIVAYSRPIAMKIYHRILEMRPAWSEKLAVVMTSSNKDPEEWRAVIGNDAHKKELERRFKDNAGPLKIVIVVDMWLTGFDVPSLATMYVYKPMAGHNLMQAIARVNRVFGDKQGGLVVDYVGIASALRQAMNDYTLRDRRNYGDPDIAKTAYPEFRKKLEVCRDLLHGYDYAGFRGDSDLARARAISGGADFLQAPERAKVKEDYIREALLLRQALSLCQSMPDREERLEAAYFEAVRTLLTRVEGKGKISFREINERINELLRQSIQSEGVINLFSDVQEEFSLFDPKFLEEIGRMKEKNLAVELLRKLIAEQVQLYRRTNTVRAAKFSEILSQAMSNYLKGMLTNEEVIEELLKTAREIIDGEKAGQALHLTTEELAFYDALTKPEAVRDFYTNDQLLAITHELTDALRKNKTIDWNLKESARAGMRRLVKRLLKKYKYPPEGQEDALNTIMEQCEMWSENS
ncbi:type I restriction endonuclease subunit R [uncultured Alistipes sp.]|uniref:type I restriction endonuclease subunit R n=1 Tax=uncultured Alistipes sp. TaxID=538949 RepID=UPI00320AEE48